jgi:hypothetical protein
LIGFQVQTCSSNVIEEGLYRLSVVKLRTFKQRVQKSYCTNLKERSALYEIEVWNRFLLKIVITWTIFLICCFFEKYSYNYSELVFCMEVKILLWLLFAFLQQIISRLSVISSGNKHLTFYKTITKYMFAISKEVKFICLKFIYFWSIMCKELNGAYTYYFKFELFEVFTDSLFSNIFYWFFHCV